MNEMQVFSNDEFGEVRTVVICDNVWFVGRDVAEVLGYAKPLNAIAAHVDEDDSLKQGLTDNLGRVQQTILINESGLYSLVISSKLPNAKKFKHWVTSEVLPSIRKHGVYAVEDVLNDPDMLISALTALKEERAKKEALMAENERHVKEIQTMKPKAEFADAVTTSETDILIGNFAKLLRQNDIQVGQKRLFKILRRDGFLMNHGERYNLPTQRAMEMGLFRVNESTYYDAYGNKKSSFTTKVTGRGQYYFFKRFKEHPELWRQD